MRAISKCTMNLAILVSILLATVHAQSTVIAPTPTCMFNTTHCSCRNVESPGICLRQTGAGKCLAAKCSSSGFTCDCSGTSVCKISSCRAYVSLVGTLTSKLGLDTIVQCRLGTVDGCLAKIDETPAASPAAPAPEFRMVQFGTASHRMMFNMSAFTDVDGRIGKNADNMHGKWADAQRLRRRFITIRMYESEGAGARMLCAVYNTYGVEDDNLGNMGAAAKIRGKDGQQLEWAACDDSGECKGGAGVELLAQHSLVSYLTDGWCVRPLEWNGNVVSVEFSGVVGMKGVVMQSTAGREQMFLFRDGESNGMTGRVDAHGLVTDGTIPEISFSLKGLAVKF